MTKPENVALTCTYCDHKWEMPLSEFKAIEVVVYRGEKDQDVTKRRVTCPNCQRKMVASIPKELLDDD